MRRTRVPQPPVDPPRRDVEQHDFWPAAAVTAIALVLLWIGARQTTGMNTLDGGSASALQLVKAFATGGLQFQKAPLSFDPTIHVDPAAAAAAMDQAARIGDLPLRARYRVNTDAADPCPT